MALHKITIPLSKKILSNNEPSASQMKKYMEKWTDLQKKRLLEQPRFSSALMEDIVLADKIAREILGIKES